MKNKKMLTIWMAEYLGSFFLSYFIWLLLYSLKNESKQSNWTKNTGYNNFTIAICYFGMNFVLMIIFASSGIITINPFLTFLNKLISLRTISSRKIIICQILGSLSSGLFAFILNRIKLGDDLVLDLLFNETKDLRTSITIFGNLINSLASNFIIGFFYYVSFKKRLINKYLSSLIISAMYLVNYIALSPYIGVFINPIILIGPAVFSLKFEYKIIFEIIILPFIGWLLGIITAQFVYEDESFNRTKSLKKDDFNINIIKPKNVVFSI